MHNNDALAPQNEPFIFETKFKFNCWSIFLFLEVGSLELDFILVHPVDYVSLSSVYLRDSAQNNLVLTPPPLTPLNFHRLSPNKIRVTAEFER